MKNVTKVQLNDAINLAWVTLYDAAREAHEIGLLQKCQDESERIERDHRRFMCRAPYRARYALSVHDAARYFVCKIVSEAHKVPKSWKEVIGWRADFPLCQALREAIKAAGKGRALIRSETFKKIDYAGDIALGAP